MYWHDYKIMKSIDETVDQLERYQGHARVVAGGTDLMVQYRQGELNGEITLLDISSVPEIKGVEEESGWIRVGAATTMRELAESTLLQNHGRALSMGAGQLGSPQIRSVATIGGNVANAQPGADTSIPLIALGAEAKIVSSRGRKWALVEDLFQDIGRSAVDASDELITHFRFRPTGEKGRSSAQRLSSRRACTLPSLVVAVTVELDNNLRCFSTVYMAAGPVAKIPWRAREAEEILIGSPVLASMVSKAASLAKMRAEPRNSLRGGAEYRREMVEVLIKRAFEDCLKPFGGMVED